MSPTARRVVALSVCGAAAQSPLEAPHLWAVFKAQHGKLFKDDAEEVRRYDVFLHSLAFIEAENAKGNNNYTLGITRFADLTDDEFAAAYTGMGEPTASSGSPLLGEHRWDGSDLPSSVDWVAQGAVTFVKDQAHCGSCWAFSATGALEGAYQISTGMLVPLSEQQFVDCPEWGGLQGCRGGVMEAAFDWAHETDLCTGKSFPYVGEEHEDCIKATCEVGIAKGLVVGHRRVAHPRFGHPSEQDLMSAVAQQPVSVAIEADKTIFRLYAGGVVSGNCGGGLDHGVLLVGYGTTKDGVDYWTVKNSWGADWGMSGYVRLLRGKGRTGECGILRMASFPVMQGDEASVV